MKFKVGDQVTYDDGQDRSYYEKVIIVAGPDEEGNYRLSIESTGGRFYQTVHGDFLRLIQVDVLSVTAPFKEEAKAHWKWLEPIIFQFHDIKNMEGGALEAFIEYLYVTAMEHGFKHGVEKAAGGAWRKRG